MAKLEMTPELMARVESALVGQADRLATKAEKSPDSLTESDWAFLMRFAAEAYGFGDGDGSYDDEDEDDEDEDDD